MQKTVMGKAMAYLVGHYAVTWDQARAACDELRIPHARGRAEGYHRVLDRHAKDKKWASGPLKPPPILSLKRESRKPKKAPVLQTRATPVRTKPLETTQPPSWSLSWNGW